MLARFMIEDASAPSVDYSAVIVTEPLCSEPEVAVTVMVPGVCVVLMMARALPLNADRELPL